MPFRWSCSWLGAKRYELWHQIFPPVRIPCHGPPVAQMLIPAKVLGHSVPSVSRTANSVMSPAHPCGSIWNTVFCHVGVSSPENNKSFINASSFVSTSSGTCLSNSATSPRSSAVFFVFIHWIALINSLRITHYYCTPVLLQFYSVSQSTIPVLLRTTSVLPSTTNYHCSTILYYKIALQYYPVLFQYCSTTPYYKKNYTVLPQHYFVLQKIIPYYNVLLQYYSVLQSTTPVLLQYDSIPQSTPPVPLRIRKYSFRIRIFSESHRIVSESDRIVSEFRVFRVRPYSFRTV